MATARVNCPSCVEFGTADVHVLLLGICEFRANRHREGRTSVVGVSAVTCVPRNVLAVRTHGAACAAVNGVTWCTVRSPLICSGS